MNDLDGNMVVSMGLFVLSSAAWFALQKSKLNASHIFTRTVLESKKEEISLLRSRHFCKNVTISYSNSGGLLIVGVSWKIVGLNSLMSRVPLFV